MTFHIWRLSDVCEDNLGLAFSADGLVLGRTPLVERCDQQFVVRKRHEIERLLRRAYETDPPVERIMPGLATVARALNADDQCLARIAAVHLRIPDLPDALARSDMEAEDRLIRYARDEGGEVDWDPAKHPRAGTPPNPGWFAPTDGGDEPPPTRVAANDPKERSDASPPTAGDDWVRLPPEPKRIDELADFIEWMANAKPSDEQTIRAEIKRYFYDVGDQGSAAELNSALTVLLRPRLTTEDRQKILDHLDVFTRADPAEYVHNRDVATDAAIAAGIVPPGKAGETARSEAASAAEAAPPQTAEGVPSQTVEQVPPPDADALDVRTYPGTLALDPWKLRWDQRGRYLEELQGRTLHPNFPVIDTFPDGLATSFKSIDLTARTYQNPRSLVQRLGDYVNELEEFTGNRWGNDDVQESAIQGRVLDVAIPRGSMTSDQRIVIKGVRDWARTLKYPIDIVFTEF